MKLEKVQIKDFQSIRDSEEFTIDDITCLVGKNEAGKTSILKALYKLNPIISSDNEFDITDDFPRVDVEDYRIDIEEGNREHTIIIKATFILDKELKSIHDNFGEDSLIENKLILKKGYDNQKIAEISVNEEKALNFCFENINASIDLKKHITDAKSFEEAKELISEFESKSEDQELIEIIRAISETGLSNYLYAEYIEPSEPKFLYFDSYYQLTGQENIEALKRRVDREDLKPSDYPMLGLLSLARIDIESLLNPDRTQELVNKIEGAGNYLSKKVLKYWSQNKHLQIKFDVRTGRAGDPDGMTSGTNIWAKIYDNKRWVTTNLSSRSKGFVWFFSFLSWYSKIKKENENVILLLDEPGLFLHAKAQSDLLRYFEEDLKPNHQLIYTTHSPFMVDSSNFGRVRIVQDISIDSDEELPREEEGTKVINDFSSATDDSLFPLQGALGYEIHQTLFVGPNCLIVEGTSDLLYLQTISGILDRLGRESLSDEWTITPVGGSDKVPTFVALLGSQIDLNIATLIDFQKKDEQKISNLYRKKLLDKKKVFTFSDFVTSTEADIEDLFDFDFYIELLNAEYKNELLKKIETTDITSSHPRTIVKMEDYFEKKPIGKGRKFSHYRPARYLSENIESLEAKISKECLERFESMFKKLNEMIK